MRRWRTRHTGPTPSGPKRPIRQGAIHTGARDLGKRFRILCSAGKQTAQEIERKGHNKWAARGSGKAHTHRASSQRLD
jgi:hypothetical protein